MNWALLLKPLDRRVILSAPVLSVTVILAILVAGQLDYSIKKSGSKILLITINSDRDDSLEETGNVSLPDDIAQEITALIRSSETGTMTLETLRALPLFQAAEPSFRSLIISFVAGELAGQHRFEETHTLLENLTPQERITSGSSFAWAVSLNGLGQEDQALAAYKIHIEANPNHQAGTINYGLLLADHDRHAEAVEIFAHAALITSGKRRGKALSSQGSSLIVLGKYAEAIPLFKRSIEYRPDHSATWRKLAIAQARIKNVQSTEIEANFRKARALAQGDTRPLLDWAHYYFANGRFKNAIPLYRNAHSLAADRFDIQFYRAINLHASGRPSSAKRILKKLSTTKWSSSRSRRLVILKAILNGSDKSIERAVRQLGKSKSDQELNRYLFTLAALETNSLDDANTNIAKIPTTSNFYLAARYARGKYFHKKGQHDDAQREFSKLVISAPQSPLVAWSYSRSLLAIGKEAAALKAIETSWQLQPESRKISIEYARQLNGSGKYAAALTILKDLSENNPRYVKAFILSGEIYENVGAIDKAINEYQRVMALGSENLTVALQLAELQMTQGHNDEALSTLDNIIERESGSIEARMLRAKLFGVMANSDLEVMELKRVLQLDQNYQPALERLSKL